MLSGPPSGISLEVENQSTLFLSLAYGLGSKLGLQKAAGHRRVAGMGSE